MTTRDYLLLEHKIYVVVVLWAQCCPPTEMNTQFLLRNIETVVEVYTVSNSWAPALNRQTKSSPKYNDNISLLI
jgi:hypothetical protein